MIVVVLGYNVCYTIIMETVLIRIRKDDRDKLKSLAGKDGRTIIEFVHRMVGADEKPAGHSNSQREEYEKTLIGLPVMTRKSRLAAWDKEHNYES